MQQRVRQRSGPRTDLDDATKIASDTEFGNTAGRRTIGQKMLTETLRRTDAVRR
ncbi:MAG: hypothetical protein JO060_04340 [Candidatus Eremiobacteraeota bacterium]|nr:hypothetical protein [Candidatus Eremiobacteraeota bacterium]MBV9647600.1 hypothetical protein [Candidatus Eremiobacteraeota bacterium]